ncbi:MAG: hypothetical protein Q4C42_01965 [Clostridia bacterium]|nr:hypothetical protein [Clostridia bacterium]
MKKKKKRNQKGAYAGPSEPVNTVSGGFGWELPEIDGFEDDVDKVSDDSTSEDLFSVPQSDEEVFDFSDADSFSEGDTDYGEIYSQDETEETAPYEYMSEEEPAEYEEDAQPEAEYEQETSEEPAVYEEEAAAAAESGKKKKKGLFGLFRRKKNDDFDEEEDLYYGVQLKPVDDLKIDDAETIPAHNPMEDTYTKLFDDSVTAIDEEVEANFNQIQRERRRRVAEAVENAGVDMDEVADEFGIVAPPPVTSFTESDAAPDDDDDSFTKAIKDQAKSRTMEIKLNVLNDTVEIQKILNMPKLDNDTIEEIAEQAKVYNTTEINLPEELPESGSGLKYTGPIEVDDLPNLTGEEPDTDIDPIESDDETPDYFQEFPVLEDNSRYRPRILPVHNIDLDVIQSGILSEAEDYDEETGEYRGRKIKTKKSRFKLFEGREEEVDDSRESIDDYTSREDAPSITTDLKSSISKLSIRTLVTGVITLVLFVMGLALEGKTYNTAVTYIILSIVLVGVCIGFCWKNITEGLLSLIRFRANSDSAAAMAALAVGIQLIVSLLAVRHIEDGNIHLYGALATGVLFLNSIGKLSLVRRIYANFRFVSSRDDKYSVRLYDDYNTSVRLAKDTVSGSPAIVYQKKAGFLKRFLELSYEADPSESASHELAPFGLVLSLVLCIFVILRTGSIISGISAFAAAACISVMATNMLGTNIPMAKFSKKARRAGAMVSGWTGVEQLAGSNCIMMSDIDLFPKGTVIIGGIKAFDSEGLEEAVVSATALINEVGGTVADVFEQVITDSGMELPKVTSIVLDGDDGVSGVVNDRHILIGNRDILISRNITPPEREDIMKYLEGGKKPLFIAVDGVLKAMLVLTYKADRRRKTEFAKFADNDLALIVHSMDANITPSLISRLYDIGESRISVVHGDLAAECMRNEATEVTRADATAATKGRIESLLSVLNASKSVKKLVNIVVLIQLIGVLLGFVIVAAVSLGSGAGAHSISALSLIFFEIIWTAVVLMVPKILEK